MKKLSTLVATFCIASFIFGYAQAQEAPMSTPDQPEQAVKEIPEGWTDAGPYYWGISVNGAVMTIKFRSRSMLKDKFDVIPLTNPPRGATQKDSRTDYWKKFSASYIEQAVKDVTEVNGIVDYAVDNHRLYFLIDIDHYWNECPDTVNEWVQKNRDTMCDVQGRVMKIIEKAFLGK